MTFQRLLLRSDYTCALDRWNPCNNILNIAHYPSPCYTITVARRLYARFYRFLSTSVSCSICLYPIRLMTGFLGRESSIKTKSSASNYCICYTSDTNLSDLLSTMYVFTTLLAFTFALFAPAANALTYNGYASTVTCSGDFFTCNDGGGTGIQHWF